MKLFTFFMILGVFNCFAGAFSQDAIISLNIKNGTLPELFDAIEKKTEYKIFYKTSIIDNNQSISLSVNEKPVSELLSMILTDQNLTYDLVDKVIVITSNVNSVQQARVTGLIKDAQTGEPLTGVNIIIEGTTVGVISDIEGKYSIEIPNADAVLAFSFVGYVPEKIAVAGQSVIDVSLIPDIKSLEEIVVVGYGTQNKRAVTGSVASIGFEKFKDRSYSNVTQALAGQLPGVSITQSQGAPGSSPIIKIRGMSSITAGTSPLYVIDGLPMENFNLNLINPQDIQSVEVLKDASSAAIYGSRGANGVIIITTKLGKPGKTTFNATYEYSIQEVAKTVDMMDAQQFIDYYIAAYNNTYAANGGTGNNPAIPAEFLNDPEQFGKGTDWQDVAFRTAPMHNVQLSVLGGTEKTQYLISGAYLDQTAVIDNNYYKRLSLRTNIKQKLSKKFSIGGNLGVTGIFDRTDGTLGKIDVVSLALQNSPIFPVYNENGNLGFIDPNSWWNRFAGKGLQLWHPYSMTREIDKQNKSFNSIGSAFLEFNIIEGLQYRSSVSGNLYNIRFNMYQNALRKYGYSTANPAEATTSSSYMFNWLTENVVTYEKQFGEHGIKALVGMTAQKQNDEYSRLTSTNFPNDLVHTLNAGTVSSGTSTASAWSMLSYLGRVNYSFQNKYFITGAVRRDGSSRFGSNNKWGYFPSISGGWLASDEEFMKGIKAISTLKLKVSYGVTGNNQIPNYGAIGTLSTSNYVNGNTIVNGLVVNSIENPNLKWEKTSQFNIGLELGLLDNRITLSAEYYSSKTKDILLNLDVPAITGFAKQLTNIGKLQNRGFEINVNSRNLVGNFTWSTDFNFSMNRNKVLELGKDGTPLYPNEWDVYTQTKIGEPISNFFGYQFDGIYNTQAEIDASVHHSSAKPGDPIIRNVNGDAVIDANDRTILGNAQPDFIAGMTNTFTYKGIELSVMLQGSFGGEIVNQQYRYCGRWNGGRNQYASNANYWKSATDPGDGKHFKPYSSVPTTHSYFSSFWVEDASYLRVRNIRLSYTLPSNLLSKFGIQSTRVYVNIENAFLFSKYSGYDPENTSYNATTYSSPGTASGSNSDITGTYNTTISDPTTSVQATGLMTGVDFASYPVPRVYTFGIKLEF
jgi:TonB-linked SusC/RagA family outer membrane protein